MADQPDPKEPLQEAKEPRYEASEKTRDAAQRIIDALIEKGATNARCSICGHDQWMVGSYVPMFVTANVNKPSLGGPTYPLVALVCLTCGNTHFINLLQLGFEREELEGLAYGELPGA